MSSLTARPLHQFELNTLSHVPDDYAWSALNDLPHGDDVVPVVDLASPDAVGHIGRACKEWGAFQVTGHGIPIHLLDRVEAQTRLLFSLPAARKLKAARGPGSLSGYGLANTSSFYSNIFWSEGFTIIGSPRDDARKLWPEDHDEYWYVHACRLSNSCTRGRLITSRFSCSCVMEEYNRRIRDLSGRLLRAMMVSLGLHQDDMDWAGLLGEADPVLQLNYYPVCPEPDRAIGIAHHTDSSFITILHQSGGESGLQLVHREDAAGPARWVTVPPRRGALVVNVGDLCEIVFNGRIRSVMHRAIVNRAQTRVSVAFFCGPPRRFNVAPIEKLIGPGEPPAYRAMSWPEFLSLKRKLYNKTLEYLRSPEEEAVHHENSA
ncbi:gibberellin 3-beta-dioxygenase [Musa troglodytarum]|uniref:Gibberellin 3-beta-dioxygenase n=1 Tax=Musa troglodytarum TaxID=320322 RepID=A0A9E7L9S7_9LILI|nr:gibberellin 3-beta-dioxygenase [Musa troglodytarum]